MLLEARPAHPVGPNRPGRGRITVPGTRLLNPVPLAVATDRRSPLVSTATAADLQRNRPPRTALPALATD